MTFCGVTNNWDGDGDSEGVNGVDFKVRVKDVVTYQIYHHFKKCIYKSKKMQTFEIMK